MYTYFDITKNCHRVQCKLYANELSDIDKVVIFCHGLGGNRDNESAELLAKLALPKNRNLAVLVFSWPNHGDDEKPKLVLSDCIEYLDIVINYVRETLGTDCIYSGGNSLGGYLILRYISLFGNPFRKIALRCPAVIIHDVLLNSIISENEYSMLQDNENADIVIDDCITIDNKFLDDLLAADIREFDYHRYADKLLIAHGTEDELIPIEAVKDFAVRNGIEFLPVAGADHSFTQPEHFVYIIKTIIGFFDLSQ